MTCTTQSVLVEWMSRRMEFQGLGVSENKWTIVSWAHMWLSGLTGSSIHGFHSVGHRSPFSLIYQLGFSRHPLIVLAWGIRKLVRRGWFFNSRTWKPMSERCHALFTISAIQSSPRFCRSPGHLPVQKS
jgi:hypothetical protein